MVFVFSYAQSEGVKMQAHLWEPFPAKDGDEARPEEADALFLKENLLATMQGVKELDSRQ
jgi:hypothetical protein